MSMCGHMLLTGRVLRSELINRTIIINVARRNGIRYGVKIDMVKYILR